MSHLLSLSELHTAAPGVLDVVFGADGEFEGAPNWHPPLWDGAWAHHFGAVPDPIDGLALDLRVPSVACRLAGLCARAGLDADHPHTSGLLHWRIKAALLDGMEWTERDAADLATLCIALAPRIRDLARRES